MGFVKEFKEFALKGNLVDMAIAFVMGGAFGKVTTAFVGKVFSPVVGLLLGGIDFKDKKLVLREAIEASEGIEAIPEVAMMWGEFITACIDFTLVAFVMFLIIKGMNAMKKKEEAPAPAAPKGPSQEELLSEIRDLLKK
jgi:large conductance mechanosensitive channel